MEVKKIKAKLSTTSLIALVAMILIVSIVQVADAEPTRTISGFDANREIFIADDGINNIIILQSDTGISKHYDSKVKTYNSGGFSMKSPESGIIVFGHPINDDQYKLLVLTSDTVYRFIGIFGIIEELYEEPISSEEIESGIIEPKSSIGADITRWDIPTKGRSDHTYEAPVEVWDPDTLDLLVYVPHTIQWLYDMNFGLIAIDTKIISEQDQRLSNVPVNVTIRNPLLEIVGTWDGTTDSFGTFGDSYYIVGNQMIGEYTLEASASKENYTSVSKMVSFFVIPLYSNDTRACPHGYSQNSTGFCIEY